MDFFDLTIQYRRHKIDIDAAVLAVLNSGKYILGPEVDVLERKLENYTGARHCITCANGTDALLVAQLALGIGPGDEVITPALNYVASAETILLLGAKPVYCDVDPVTYNLDPAHLESLITVRTKCIIPVSLYGQCADYDSINEIAAKYSLTVIEDAAQSFGGEYKSRKSCNLTKVATTSFFPTKPLGCYGDGGAIFTNDDDLALVIRQIARHGQSKKYQHARLGVNSRLDTIQAAVLNIKLAGLDDEINGRHLIAMAYNEMIGMASVTPLVMPHNRSAWAQYTIKLNNRERALSMLSEAGIPSVIHYPMPVYKQKAMRDESAACLVTERLCQQVVSLPIGENVTISDVEKISQIIRIAEYSR